MAQETLFEQIAREVSDDTARGQARSPVSGPETRAYTLKGKAAHGGMNWAGMDPLTRQLTFGSVTGGQPAPARSSFQMLGPPPATPAPQAPLALPRSQVMGELMPGPRVFAQGPASAPTGSAGASGASSAARTAAMGFGDDALLAGQLASAAGARPRMTFLPEGGLRATSLRAPASSVLDDLLVRGADGGIRRGATAMRGLRNYGMIGLPIELGGNLLMNATGADDRIYTQDSNLLDEVLQGFKTGGSFGAIAGPKGALIGGIANAIANPVAHAITGDQADIGTLISKIPVAGAFLAPDAAEREGRVENANSVYDEALANGYTQLQANILATRANQGRPMGAVEGPDGQMTIDPAKQAEELAAAQQRAADQGIPGALDNMPQDATLAQAQAQVAMGLGFDAEDVAQRQGVFQQMISLGLSPSVAFRTAYVGTPIHEQVMSMVSGGGTDPAAVQQFIQPYVDRMNEASNQMYGSLGPSTRAIANAYGAAAQLGAAQSSQQAIDQLFVGGNDYLSFLLGQDKLAAESVPNEVLLGMASQG